MKDGPEDFRNRKQRINELEERVEQLEKIVSGRDERPTVKVTECLLCGELSEEHLIREHDAGFRTQSMTCTNCCDEAEPKRDDDEYRTVYE